MFLPGGSEWIILLVVVVVLLFGARKIPEIARSIGRARGELERGKHESEEELRKWREGGEKKKEEPTEREKLEEAAKALGLAVEGKSDEEIRAALKKALEKSSP
jgi:sec-independent protein translocase protein TatA